MIKDGEFICDNCASKFSCSCKEVIASDGKKCCTNCIQKYEYSITGLVNLSYNPGSHVAERPDTAPTNVRILYTRTE